MKLRLSVCSGTGCVRWAGEAEDEIWLSWRGRYEAGDALVLEAEVEGVWLWLQLDICLEPSLVLMAQGRLVFSIPSRGLIGYRDEFMTDTKGNGIINTIFDKYGPYKGDIAYRKTGSLIAFEAGESITYGLFNAQMRGPLFIGPGVKVYQGMVVGENPKGGDIELNVCKKKQMTNTRSAGSDDALKLVPPKQMSLEQALDFIENDELVEVTPKSFRIRKKILDPKQRMRANKR